MYDGFWASFRYTLWRWTWNFIFWGFNMLLLQMPTKILVTDISSTKATINVASLVILMTFNHMVLQISYGCSFRSTNQALVCGPICMIFQVSLKKYQAQVLNLLSDAHWLRIKINLQLRLVIQTEEIFERTRNIRSCISRSCDSCLNGSKFLMWRSQTWTLHRKLDIWPFYLHGVYPPRNELYFGLVVPSLLISPNQQFPRPSPEVMWTVEYKI